MIDDYLLVVGIAMGIFAIAIPLAYGRARGGRWGERESKQRVGDDPFRGGEVTDRRPKRAPAWVRFAAGVSAAWAVASMLLFAPLHALLAAFTADSTPSPLEVIALSLVAVDSLVWPIAMLVACRALLVRRRLSTVRAALRWSYVHHGCGLLAIVIVAGSIQRSDPLALVLMGLGWSATGVAIAGWTELALRAAQAITADVGDAIEAA